MGQDGPFSNSSSRGVMTPCCLILSREAIITARAWQTGVSFPEGLHGLRVCGVAGEVEPPQAFQGDNRSGAEQVGACLDPLSSSAGLPRNRERLLVACG